MSELPQQPDPTCTRSSGSTATPTRTAASTTISVERAGRGEVELELDDRALPGVSEHLELANDLQVELDPREDPAGTSVWVDRGPRPGRRLRRA